ncbi:MAG TPA: Xaa-Pro peptidase family protein [Chloroflexota bacterium]|nr:Xaa-Pro peptidase family protein [Chloroflexota bacterium]
MPDANQFPQFSESEMINRHRVMRQIMEDAKVDAALIFGAGRFASDVYWLTDWPGGREAYVLCQPAADPVVLAQLYNHVPMARVLSWVKDVRWAGPSTAATVVELLRERRLDGKRVGLVGAIPFQHFQRIREACPAAELIDLGGRLRSARAIRSDEEIERLKMASKLTDDSIRALADALKPGLREYELPAVLEPVYLKAGGYAGIHFMTSMPMRAPNFPVPSQFQSNRTLAVGDCVITEISGAYWGYSGQIHRTFSLGEGPTPEWRALHDAAVEAFEVIVGLIKDGTSTREVEEASEVIHRRGYSIYDDLLHGASQYPPIIQTRSTSRREGGDMTFRENMVITIQPNVITRDERMGLQFGETVVVRRAGCEPLNAIPREWIVCEG